MSWVAQGKDFDSVAAGLDSIGPLFSALYRGFWTLPQVPAEVLELCRLRQAQLHDCDFQWAREEVALAVGKRDNLRDWARDPVFTDAERACLAYTEVHAMDAQAISDEQADAVKAHFGEEGLVALTEALGVFDGITRLSMVWGLGEAS